MNGRWTVTLTSRKVTSGLNALFLQSRYRGFTNAGGFFIQGMRMVLFVRIAAFIPIAINLLLWLRYYLPITVKQDYHAAYFLMAILPAIVFAAIIWVLIMKPGRPRVWAGIFSVPALLIWMVSVVLVGEEFRVH